MTIDSLMFLLDDGHVHTNPEPKVWCDEGGDSLYANGVVVQPFFGGTTGLGAVKYVVQVCSTPRTIKSMDPHPDGSGGFDGVTVLLDNLTELEVVFVNGVTVIA